MSVNHGSLKIDMAKKLLNDPDVISVFQKMCCKTMSQGMNGCLFSDSRFCNRCLECLLERSRMNMVPPYLSLILFTGIITVLPELSVKYILFRKNKGKSEIGDSVRRSIGDTGREFIVNNYSKIILEKNEEKNLNIMYEFLLSQQPNINSFIIYHFISTLISMGLS
jgi:hypothetical protein